MSRRAKIMGTLGPASSDAETLRALLDGGLDVVRLNLSHGDHAGHRETIGRVRAIAAELGRHVPVVLDLMGPRYRLGRFEGERELTEGAELTLVDANGADDPPAEDVLPVDEEILDHLSDGERLLVDDGLIELEVLAVEGGRTRARVVAGGRVSSRKGLNLPDSRLPFVVTPKDEADIRFAVDQGVDYVAASYVGGGDDVGQVRRRLAEAGAEIPIIAKLERSAAVEELDSIVRGADALMVARGDLGVEVPLPRVPVLQKEMIAAGRRAGKPVIVATQMLESMIEQPMPTRAEATDVANAVFDGADALMLSGETAAGHHPVEAVRTMESIIREAEAYGGASGGGFSGPYGRLGHLALGRDDGHDFPDVVSRAAVEAADQLGARALVAFSQSGFTARLVARYRPAPPIRVLTPNDALARRLQLFWGVTPIVYEGDLDHHDEVVEVVDRELLARGLAEPGDAIVILMGDPIRNRPRTNLMRLHRVAVEDG